MPCLLLDGPALVKTIGFGSPVYVGDPINVINIFNTFEVDELCLLDIGAPRRSAPPQFDLVRRVAQECLMPVSYGGGVRTLDDVSRLIEGGAEKIILNSVLVSQPDLVTDAAARFGSQAVIASVDAVRRSTGRYEAMVGAARVATDLDPGMMARRAQDLGAGEILLTSIDRDGTMSGYDTDLISSVAKAVDVPVIASGGAGSRRDLVPPIAAGASAVAAGSLFVFQGRNRAVLINFPTRSQIENLYRGLTHP